jgi:hypothetical protein
MPLDFELLERLPEKGTIGGIHWKGRRVKDLRLEIIEAADLEDPNILPTSLVQARLRSMHVAGFVENFPGSVGNNAVIWARTPQGNDHLARREELMG